MCRSCKWFIFQNEDFTLMRTKKAHVLQYELLLQSYNASPFLLEGLSLLPNIGGLLGKMGATFFGGWEGGCNFYIEIIKIKLKSEIFNDKKIYKQKCFPPS